MTLEEGARGDTPSSGAPETDDIRKNIEYVYREKPQICLADNSILVSREHDLVRGGTTGPRVKRFS